MPPARTRAAPATPADPVAPAAPPTEAVEVTTWDQLVQLATTDTRPVERVVVHEWPGSPVVYLRGLSGHERDTIENTTFGDGVNDISAKIVARSLCRPDGQPLVPRTAREMAAAERMLTQRSAGGLLHLQRIARRLSGMDAGAVEELEAILSKVQSGSDGTG